MRLFFLFRRRFIIVELAGFIVLIRVLRPVVSASALTSSPTDFYFPPVVAVLPPAFFAAPLVVFAESLLFAAIV
jgi:hypothetical protein